MFLDKLNMIIQIKNSLNNEPEGRELCRVKWPWKVKTEVGLTVKAFSGWDKHVQTKAEEEKTLFTDRTVRMYLQNLLTFW